MNLRAVSFDTALLLSRMSQVNTHASIYLANGNTEMKRSLIEVLPKGYRVGVSLLGFLEVGDGMIKKYVIHNLPRYIIGGISLIASIGFDIWFPLITMSIVDDVIIGKNMDMLKTDLICILICGLGRACTQYVKEYLCDMAGCTVAESLRKDTMKHIQKLSKSFFDENNTGELMARVKDDAGRIWDLFGFVGMLLIEAVGYLVGVIICMVRLNFKLSLIPIAFLPIMGFLVMKIEKKLSNVYDRISEENATLNRVIEENISGVRTVKAFASEEYEIGKFDKENDAYKELNVEEASYMANIEPVIGLIPKLMQGCMIAIGGYAAIKGNITYGLLVAFMQYTGNIVWPIENMGWLLDCTSSGIASYKKVKKIFAAQPEIKEIENPVSLNDNKGTLKFNNVVFNLDGKTILKDVSFELPQGKTLGIMGSTGTGKSMMVNLIERFYDVDEGSITINDVDIKNIKLDDVRNFSSVVTQDIFLFSDTIKENVKLGNKQNMSDETVHHAIRKAHAKEFVEKITGGYDAVIGERGIGLSGGQKQRLSIARALAKKAGILIMDDSTSALDMETESDIQKEIGKKTDMSKIIIGHRISSVKDADEIIVLDEGRIAERGTHAELLAKKGLYYSTYEAQYGNYHEAMKVMGGVS